MVYIRWKILSLRRSHFHHSCQNWFVCWKVFSASPKVFFLFRKLFLSAAVALLKTCGAYSPLYAACEKIIQAHDHEQSSKPRPARLQILVKRDAWLHWWLPHFCLQSDDFLKSPITRCRKCLLSSHWWFPHAATFHNISLYRGVTFPFLQSDLPASCVRPSTGCFFSISSILTLVFTLRKFLDVISQSL